MNKQYLLLALLAILMLLLFSACHPGHERYTIEAPAGFWWGIWHGFISLFTLIGSIFSDNVTIYEVHNNGFWYNFGFLIGVGSFSGGSFFSICRRN